MKLKFKSQALVLALSLGLSAQAYSGTAPSPKIPGEIQEPKPVLESYESIGSISQELLGGMLAQYGITPRNGIDIYKLTYSTTSPKGEIVKASGALIVPQAKQAIYPWISLQHGTLASKLNAPSIAPSEGLVEGSQGFVTVIADYIGYGASEDLPHPYIIADSYQAPVLDMLRAARETASQIQVNLGPLFLKGYSEGGYATLALQKAIETDSELAAEFPIAASSPSAGPYDVLQTGSLNIQKPVVNPINLPFVVLSYDYWLANETLPLDDIFEVDTDVVKEALDGNHSAQEIFQILPTKADALFNAVFIQDFLAPKPTLPGVKEFQDLLRSQNLVENWTPKAPTRFYHCVDDEEIPVAVTESTVAKFQGRGATNVQKVVIPSPSADAPYRHSQCPAIFAPVQWFAELLTPAS